MGDLAVSLTVEQLRALIREEVRGASSPAAPVDVEVMTRAQVAALLQVHPNVVPRYIRKWGLPSHKVGGEYRFVRAEVMQWIATRKGAA